MCAVFDQKLRPLLRCFPSKVRNALFGDDHIHVVLRVIHMGDHRDDPRDIPVLCRRRCRKDADRRIACEVPAAADAVHDLRAHGVRRVDVAVQVHFDGRIERDDAKPADDLGVVGDLLRPDDYLIAESLYVVIKLFFVFFSQCHGTCGNTAEHAFLQQREGCILHHFRIHAEPAEATFCKACEHRIADASHARLDRTGVFRQSACCDLRLQECNYVLADLLRLRRDRLELLRFIREI